MEVSDGADQFQSLLTDPLVEFSIEHAELVFRDTARGDIEQSRPAGRGRAFVVELAERLQLNDDLGPILPVHTDFANQFFV